MTLTAPPADTNRPRRTPPTASTGAVLRLARWSTKHSAKALIGWFLFVAAVFVGGNLAGTRLLEGAETGTGESGRADRIVEQAGYPATPTERILVQARTGSLDAATATAVGTELRTRLTGMQQVGQVGELIRSQDGRSALLPGRAERERQDRQRGLRRGRRPGATRCSRSPRTSPRPTPT